MKATVRASRRMTTGQRREQIISAAMKCFARKGFSGTTTRMLAGAAGVSEALVFRHFPDKKSLYRAIVERKSAEPRVGLFPAEKAAAGDDRGVLTSIATTFLERIDGDPTFLRLLMWSSLERNTFARLFFESRGTTVVSFLSTYLQARMRAGGGLRRMDATVAARAFLGMVLHYLNMKHILQIPMEKRRNEELVALWVELFLKGLER